MRGAKGVSMQSIEHAPKKKGNVRCCECAHLIYKPAKPSKKQINPSYYCDSKKEPRWYTARCYCKSFLERSAK